MAKSTYMFIALCVAAPAMLLLERYGLFHWEDEVLSSLLIGGLVLSVVVLFWSLASVRLHKVRAIVGAFVCAYCFWQAFQNGKVVF